MDMICSRATEAELKATFLEFLLRSGRITRRSLVSNEYQVHGATRRADLAILDRGRFIGVEVKSEFDTLTRLEAQTAAYLQVFDQVLVLVAQRHCVSAEKLLSPAVALYCVTDNGQVVEVRNSQSGELPDDDLRKSAILLALPKSTLLRLAKLTSGRYSRKHLMESLRVLTVEALRAALLAEFKQRYGATSKTFWSLVSRRRTISTSYLPVLSRFASLRKPASDGKENQKTRWEVWLSRRQSMQTAERA